MKIITVLIACAALSGCASIGDILGKGAFRNRASCTLDRQTALSSSFWFRWLAITSELDPADAAVMCAERVMVVRPAGMAER